MKTIPPTGHFHANETRFHEKDFARRLVLKQRHEATLKWPIVRTEKYVCTVRRIRTRMRLISIFMIVFKEGQFKRELVSDNPTQIIVGCWYPVLPRIKLARALH